MDKLIYFNGGRPLRNDDLQQLEAGVEDASKAIALGLGQDCILSGCTSVVSGSVLTVNPGYVLINEEVFKVPLHSVSYTAGATYRFRAEVTAVDPRVYADASTDDTREIRVAKVVLNHPTGPALETPNFIGLIREPSQTRLDVIEDAWLSITASQVALQDLSNNVIASTSQSGEVNYKVIGSRLDMNFNLSYPGVNLSSTTFRLVFPSSFPLFPRASFQASGFIKAHVGGFLPGNTPPAIYQVILTLAGSRSVRIITTSTGSGSLDIQGQIVVELA